MMDIENGLDYKYQGNDTVTDEDDIVQRGPDGDSGRGVDTDGDHRHEAGDFYHLAENVILLEFWKQNLRIISLFHASNKLWSSACFPHFEVIQT